LHHIQQEGLFFQYSSWLQVLRLEMRQVLQQGLQQGLQQVLQQGLQQVLQQVLLLGMNIQNILPVLLQIMLLKK
jgi:hypothetical protein